MRIFLIVSIFIVLLQGCTSPFAKYYNDETGGIDITKIKYVILPTEEPKLYYGDDEAKDSLRMAENNYRSVGNSSFYTDSINDADAIDQAKAVHAEVVMLYSKYKRTVSGNAPLTLPNTTTSSTNFSGNAYGSGGSATYSGTANTTNYGTKTTYIPYSYDQSDFLAIYWIKSKPRIFGINYEDLTEDIRRKTGSNKGVLVTVVTKDSPAFDADILRGDVIKNIGDVLITNIDLANKTIDKYQGQEVDVLIFRDDKEIHKKVKLRKEPN